MSPYYASLNNKNEEKENELKSVEAQLAAIQIPAKNKTFKKVTISSAVLCVVSFLIFTALTIVHPHKETPFAPTSIELIAITCGFCFLILTFLLLCLWVSYYTQLEAVKMRSSLKKTRECLKKSLHNEQKTLLVNFNNLKEQIQKEHESLLHYTTLLELEISRKKKAAKLDTHRDHLGGNPTGQLYQQYADGVQECARVFGPEAKQYLEEMSVKAQKSVLSS